MADSPKNPFDGVTDFFSEMSRMWELGTHGRERGHEDRDRTHATAWVPATDIFTRGGDLGIRIEVAGLDPDDIEITFAQGTLTVSGSAGRSWEPTEMTASTSASASTEHSGGRSHCPPTPTKARSAQSSRTAWWTSPSRAAPPPAIRAGSRCRTGPGAATTRSLG